MTKLKQEIDSNGLVKSSSWREWKKTLSRGTCWGFWLFSSCSEWECSGIKHLVFDPSTWKIVSPTNQLPLPIQTKGLDK